MKTASKEKLISVLKSGNVRLWNYYVRWCRRLNPDWRADLSDSDLSGADLNWCNLRGVNLRGANLFFASWPLWCGGTMATVDRRLSLQLIYHMFNQNHQDADVRAALEHLRPLAQEFKDRYRSDAPELWKGVAE